jgi:alkylation response protein AidB-like acyl-CoA dehydrogenase
MDRPESQRYRWIGAPGVIPYLTDEQLQLRTAVRTMLAARAPIATTRAAMSGATGYDVGVWHQLSQDMGLVGLALDESRGGFGPAYVELALVMEELGYLCVGGPMLPTVTAAAALSCGSGPTSDAVLRRLAAGEATATLCVAGDDGEWSGDPPVAAERDETGDWVLTGSSAFVVEGETADLLAVAARAADGVGLFVVEATAPGLDRRPAPTLDQTRRLARITFDHVAARSVVDAGAGAAAVERALTVAAVLLAAEQLGGARACLAMAVQYAKVREQFGRPIGSFQAIKHRCADMLVKTDSASSAVFYASRLLDSEDQTELAAVASLAKAYCSDAFFDVAADNIQIHGGIGFTWEHDAHLYFKRATCSRLLFGDPVRHREQLLQRIGI